jgi:hypothetical protein
MSALAVPYSCAPDLIEPVIGFRQWDVRGGQLYSPFHGDLWEDVELHACCQLGTHDAADVPAEDCACGVYAYYAQPPRSAAATRQLVTGAVMMSGQMQLHGSGMRASRARIVELALPLTNGPKRRQLVAAAAYLEVPVVPARQLKRVAARHGAPLPSALRPPRTPLPWECPMGAARVDGRRSVFRQGR